jgi:hypothetical protein
MPLTRDKSKSFRLPMLQGVLPVSGAQIPSEIIAGNTLAALAVPEVMGYTKISGTPDDVDSFEVWQARRLWQCCPAAFTALNEAVERWCFGIADLAKLDVARFLPHLPALGGEFEARLAVVGGMRSCQTATCSKAASVGRGFTSRPPVTWSRLISPREMETASMRPWPVPSPKALIVDQNRQQG